MSLLTTAAAEAQARAYAAKARQLVKEADASTDSWVRRDLYSEAANRFKSAASILEENGGSLWEIRTYWHGTDSAIANETRVCIHLQNDIYLSKLKSSLEACDSALARLKGVNQ